MTEAATQVPFYQRREPMRSLGKGLALTSIVSIMALAIIARVWGRRGFALGTGVGLGSGYLAVRLFRGEYLSDPVVQGEIKRKIERKDSLWGEGTLEERYRRADQHWEALGFTAEELRQRVEALDFATLYEARALTMRIGIGDCSWHRERLEQIRQTLLQDRDRIGLEGLLTDHLEVLKAFCNESWASWFEAQVSDWSLDLIRQKMDWAIDRGLLSLECPPILNGLIDRIVVGKDPLMHLPEALRAPYLEWCATLKRLGKERNRALKEAPRICAKAMEAAQSVRNEKFGRLDHELKGLDQPPEDSALEAARAKLILLKMGVYPPRPNRQEEVVFLLEHRDCWPEYALTELVEQNYKAQELSANCAMAWARDCRDPVAIALAGAKCENLREMLSECAQAHEAYVSTHERLLEEQNLLSSFEPAVAGARPLSYLPPVPPADPPEPDPDVLAGLQREVREAEEAMQPEIEARKQQSAGIQAQKAEAERVLKEATAQTLAQRDQATSAAKAAYERSKGEALEALREQLEPLRKA